MNTQNSLLWIKVSSPQFRKNSKYPEWGLSNAACSIPSISNAQLILAMIIGSTYRVGFVIKQYIEIILPFQTFLNSDFYW